MFEIILFCAVALAAGYWMTLWLMGRHNDVLYGDFIEAEPQVEILPAPLPPALLDRRDSLQSLLNSIQQELNDVVPT